MRNAWSTPFLDSRRAPGFVLKGEQADIYAALHGLRSGAVNAGISVADTPPIGIGAGDLRQSPAPAVLTAETPPDVARKIPQSTFEPSRYGPWVPLSIPLVANQDTVALTRPHGLRVLLVIYNSTLGPLFFSFDQEASAQSMPILAGNYAFFDAVVPQNDLHLMAPAGGQVPIGYINTSADGSEAVQSPFVARAAAPGRSSGILRAGGGSRLLGAAR